MVSLGNLDSRIQGCPSSSMIKATEPEDCWPGSRNDLVVEQGRTGFHYPYKAGARRQEVMALS